MSNDFDPYSQWLGIPPQDRPPNYYRLLDIDLFESDQNVINSAAHQRYLYIQSFQTGDNAELAKKILREIAVAGVCLLTPQKKAAYDVALKSKLQGKKQVPQDYPDVSMYIAEPVKTSQIINTRNANKYSQLWSFIVGFLMLAGIIVAVLAINKNLRDVANLQPDPPNKNIDAPTQIGIGKSRKGSEQYGRHLKNPPSHVSQLIPEPAITDLEEKHDSRDESENTTPESITAVPGHENDSKQEHPPVIPAINVQPQPANRLDVLPSGKKFEPDFFAVNMDELITQFNYFADKQQIIILRYPDGHAALAMHKMGVLHGSCVAFGSDGKPILLAYYKDGQLDGLLKTWDEKGRRIYWCQYANGFRNGLCCYYKDDQFRVLLEIYHDTIKAVYMVSNGKLENSVDPNKQDDLEADAKQLLKELRSQIYVSFNRDKILFENQFNKEFVRLQWELSSLMRAKGLNAVKSRIKEYNDECKRLINNLRNSDIWKKSVW